MKTVLMFFVAALVGCAGTAKYEIKHGDSTLTVFNTKDVGEINAKAMFDPDSGQFVITLDEKSVSASGPIAQQNEMIKALLPLVVKSR